MMKVSKGFAFMLFYIACLINIYLGPLNKYEWMLADDPNMTLPIDEKSFFYAIFAILPIPFLFLFLIKNTTKKMLLLITVSAATLVLMWRVKYHSLFV